MNKVLLVALFSASTALAGAFIVSSGSRNTSLAPSTTDAVTTESSPTNRSSPYPSASPRSSNGNEPNDPFFYLQRPTFASIDAGRLLQEDEGRGVVVAVIDTGVNFGDDLDPRKFVPGYDFVEGRVISRPEESIDPGRHGSFIAAIIAQSTNNGIGTVGLAPETKIMPLRVLNATLDGETSALDKAIRYAVDHRADVINLSLARPTSSNELAAAVDYAYQHNVVVIAASGNANEQREFYPAAYDEVLGVGSVNQAGQIAPYSNVAPIYAPGGIIIVDSKPGRSQACQTSKISQGTEPDPKIAGAIFQMIPVLVDGSQESRLMACQGTSQATAFVTGIASSVKSIFKAKGIHSPEAVFQVILESAKTVNGRRVLDADDAIRLAQILVNPQITISESERYKRDELIDNLKRKGDVFVAQGARMINSYKIQGAFTIYSDLDKLGEGAKIDPQDWNTVCWFGTLVAGIRGRTTTIAGMMKACNNAVTNSSDTLQASISLDSRAVARALTGNFSGAIRDFEDSLDKGNFSNHPYLREQRQRWISELRIGRVPFTPSVLKTSLTNPDESGTVAQ